MRYPVSGFPSVPASNALRSGSKMGHTVTITDRTALLSVLVACTTGTTGRYTTEYAARQIPPCVDVEYVACAYWCTLWHTVPAEGVPPEPL